MSEKPYRVKERETNTQTSEFVVIGPDDYYRPYYDDAEAYDHADYLNEAYEQGRLSLLAQRDRLAGMLETIIVDHETSEDGYVYDGIIEQARAALASVKESQ